ncbi:WxL domain-containing protein [Vagococcus sp. BWB3-3]|uniref:WxL domain-containing protein n=1 Tax=Vagococcus allomyrinae TaxID=2794353 RepID=A0A940P1R3_9ENTE|nr:WxL domain-containing protein [Vagococcus allomyrinae]MBP1039455.1 WxL domain-containing protein [Vagococcus allomyrinae]
MKAKSLLGVALLSSILFLQGPAALAATTSQADSKADIEFLENDGPTNPKDPLEPKEDEDWEPEDEDEITGNKGPLSIDYISNLHFGKVKMSGNVSSFFAENTVNKDTVTKRPNFVQVSDHRGSGAGWTLTVQQDTPFAVADGSAKIEATTLSLLNGYVNSVNNTGVDVRPVASQSIVIKPGAGAVKVSGAAGDGTKGMGSWTTAFGDTDEKGLESVKLTIPANTKINKAAYSTTLSWTLTDDPSN